MTLTYTAHGRTVSVRTDHDDLTIDQVLEHLRSLLLAAGFHPKTVEEALGPA